MIIEIIWYCTVHDTYYHFDKNNQYYTWYVDVNHGLVDYNLYLSFGGSENSYGYSNGTTGGCSNWQIINGNNSNYYRNYMVLYDT